MTDDAKVWGAEPMTSLPHRPPAPAWRDELVADWLATLWPDDRDEMGATEVKALNLVLDFLGSTPVGTMLEELDRNARLVTLPFVAEAAILFLDEVKRTDLGESLARAQAEGLQRIRPVLELVARPVAETSPPRLRLVEE